MGESRLSALALMHIKYDMRIMPVNLDEIAASRDRLVTQSRDLARHAIFGEERLRDESKERLPEGGYARVGRSAL